MVAKRVALAFAAVLFAGMAVAGGPLDVLPPAVHDPGVATVEEVLGFGWGAEITDPEQIVKYAQALAASAPSRVRLLELRAFTGRALAAAARDRLPRQPPAVGRGPGGPRGARRLQVHRAGEGGRAGPRPAGRCLDPVLGARRRSLRRRCRPRAGVPTRIGERRGGREDPRQHRGRRRSGPKPRWAGALRRIEPAGQRSLARPRARERGARAALAGWTGLARPLRPQPGLVRAQPAGDRGAGRGDAALSPDRDRRPPRDGRGGGVLLRSAGRPAPPVAGREGDALLDLLGRGNAAAFDAHGFRYWTREVFDAFYPGYGDSWPALTGAVGMTLSKPRAGAW